MLLEGLGQLGSWAADAVKKKLKLL